MKPQRKDDVVDALLHVYRLGAFPMAAPESGLVQLYSPDPRAIIPLEPASAFHVPRSLAKRIKSGFFEVRADSSFEVVIRRCAESRQSPEWNGTWLSPEMIDAYVALHHAGHAHSIESWRTDSLGRQELVGGVYGVSIGSAFFAESMFSRPKDRRPDGSRDPFDGSDASSVALVRLVQHLRRCGYTLLDVQFWNPHIARFGVVEIPRQQFMVQLATAAGQPECWIAPSESDLNAR